MNLIEFTCPKCGANLQINSELKSATCNYCGASFAIDDGKIQMEVSISNAKEFGYAMELGRMEAQRKAQQEVFFESKASRKFAILGALFGILFIIMGFIVPKRGIFLLVIGIALFIYSQVLDFSLVNVTITNNTLTIKQRTRNRLLRTIPLKSIINMEASASHLYVELVNENVTFITGDAMKIKQIFYSDMVNRT